MEGSIATVRRALAQGFAFLAAWQLKIDLGFPRSRGRHPRLSILSRCVDGDRAVPPHLGDAALAEGYRLPRGRPAPLCGEDRVQYRTGHDAFWPLEIPKRERRRACESVEQLRTSKQAALSLRTTAGVASGSASPATSCICAARL
jgi:hypothetical protein